MFRIPQQRLLISQAATDGREDEVDITKDISDLTISAGIETLHIFTQALVFSQLFDVPLKKGCPYLFYSLRLKNLQSLKTHERMLS